MVYIIMCVLTFLISMLYRSTHFLNAPTTNQLGIGSVRWNTSRRPHASGECSCGYPIFSRSDGSFRRSAQFKRSPWANAAVQLCVPYRTDQRDVCHLSGNCTTCRPCHLGRLSADIHVL